MDNRAAPQIHEKEFEEDRSKKVEGIERSKLHESQIVLLKTRCLMYLWQKKFVTTLCTAPLVLILH